MSSLTSRIWLAALLLATMAAAVGFIRRGGWVDAPDINPILSRLPPHVGSWTLEENEAKQSFLEPPSDAASAVNGVYRDPAGVRIFVEMDMFTLLDVSLPHPPEQCYNLSGCRVLGERDTSVPVAENTAITTKLMAVEHNGQRMSVLFWYNLDKEVVVDRFGLGAVRLKLRNQKRRPLVVKVMMQTISPNMGEAEDRLRSLAGPLLVWIRQAQGGPEKQ